MYNRNGSIGTQPDHNPQEIANYVRGKCKSEHLHESGVLGNFFYIHLWVCVRLHSYNTEGSAKRGSAMDGSRNFLVDSVNIVGDPDRNIARDQFVCVD